MSFPCIQKQQQNSLLTPFSNFHFKLTQNSAFFLEVRRTLYNHEIKAATKEIENVLDVRVLLPKRNFVGEFVYPNSKFVDEVAILGAYTPL